MTRDDEKSTVANSVFDLIKEDNDPTYRYRSVNRLDVLAAESLRDKTSRNSGMTGTRILLDKMNRKLEWGWSERAYDVKAMMANRSRSH